MHILKVKLTDDCPNKEFVKEYYLKKANNVAYENDSGLDIIFPADQTFVTNKVTRCNLGIECELVPRDVNISGSFDLRPRSSISNTPLMLANSVGLFDESYRGPIIAAFRCFVDKDHPSTMLNGTYTCNKGDRFVQIVAVDHKPIKVELVTELSVTARGKNGFGSTNTKV